MAGLLGGGEGGLLQSVTGGDGPLQNITGGDSDGPLGAVNGLTGGGGLGGLTGGLGGLTSGLGGLTGGDLGALGGLLGSGEGLNLIGLVGIGSDDPALLDLNPAVKKSKKAEILAKAKAREKARNEARQKLLKQIKEQGGQPTPEQTQLLKKLDDQIMQDDLEMAKVNKLVPDDVGPAQGFPAGLTSSTSQGGGQYGPGPGVAEPSVAGSSISGSGAHAQYAPCISICQHTMANYAPTTSIFYAYLVDTERRDQSKPPSYLMTFANASVADAWYREVSSHYQVQKVTHQFYTFRGQAPYPVTYDTRFAGSSVGSCMVISGIKQDGCQMLVPPQTPEGYLVGHSWQRVAVINQPCHICGSSPGTGVSGYQPPGYVPGGPVGKTPTNALPTNSLPTNSLPLNKLPTNNLPNNNLPTNNLPTNNLPTNNLPTNNLPTNNLPGNTGSSGNQGSGSTGTSGGQGGQSSGGLTLLQAAGIAAQQAKQNGDPRPLQDITNDFYNQLKGSCCQSEKVGGGSSGGLAGGSGIPATGGQLPVNGAPNTAQNGGDGGGGLGGILGGVTGGLGGLTGGLGGATGGLLPGSQGLNVAGILAIGSDESALVDLNPAEKRQKKMERLQQLQQVKSQNMQKMNQIKQEVDRNGGRATPEHQAQYAEAQKNIQAANQAESMVKASMGKDDTAGGLAGSLGGLGGGLPVGGGFV